MPMFSSQPQLWPTLPEKILGRLVRGQGRIPLVAVLGSPADAAWAQGIAAAAGAAVWAMAVNPPKVRLRPRNRPVISFFMG